jgi:hypothetical protein
MHRMVRKIVERIRKELTGGWRILYNFGLKLLKPSDTNIIIIIILIIA